ncbi:hypothetical protein IWW42_000148 [Coemansia sp. RSA 1085]|nr:hypothetical protein IWW42_000148 [Coemansia sp. RSA 1085]
MDDGNGSNQDKDKKLLQTLDTFAEYQSRREVAHSKLRQGYFDLALAKRAAGYRWISPDLYSGNAQAIKTIHIDPTSGALSIQQEQAAHEQNDSQQLRRRKQKNNSEKEQKEHREKSKDPLLWFGMLVPPALKDAQAQFNETLDILVELAELKRQLENCPLLETTKQKMVWLAWDDCRSLFQVFRHFEYVDKSGKPTSLVDSYVSRITDGEAANLSSVGRVNSSADSDIDDELQTAAWLLISRIFARATALRISAEAEEVAEEDALAVLTWFPKLEYLETQQIPRPALSFWSSWLPGRLGCLKMEYAGLDLADIVGTNEQLWQRLLLLDLANNPGLDLEPLRGSLTQQVPNLARLSLAQCELDSVPNVLSTLYNLTWLDLSGNSIASVEDISLRLGNLVRLNLARNQLTAIAGIRRMWALEILDVSENQLEEWSAVLALRNLPLLRELNVHGNPFAENEHRAQIFSAFDHRDVGLLLDGRAPTSQERREMAKIPRVATQHHAGVPAAAAEASAAKLRRPKVAIIEESADADIESDNAAGDHGNDIDEACASPDKVLSPALSPLEKMPRVLRASELQAVAVASAHRRSNVDYSLLRAPSVSGISMKPRARGKRRATAATLNGGLSFGSGRGPHHRSTASHMHSMPSSFMSRPSSPVPSSIAGSIRTGTSSFRDPERYRRRVEMMRAEAGSSWLRAFAELQQQKHQPSQEPSSLPAIGEAPLAETENSSVSSQEQPPTLSRADTQLPSFLFPRRKTASVLRKTDLPRLPHYSPSDSQVKQVVEQAQPESIVSAGLSAVEDLSDNGSVANSSDETEADKIEHEDELQKLLRGEGVITRVENVAVAQFKLLPSVEADGKRTRQLQRSETGLCIVFVTESELIVADQAINDRVQLKSLVRLRKCSHDRLIVDVKSDRLESPVWIEFATTDQALLEALQAAVATNAGLEAQVYKQTECLRCNWRDYVDTEHAALDELVAGNLVVLVAVPPLQCPSCKRRYMREFYAAHENDEADAGAAEIRNLVGRARKPRGSKVRQSTVQQHTQDNIKQIAEAQEAVVASQTELGAVAEPISMPFAQATNAVRLFLQLSVFADGERLLQWVPAGLVRQAAPLVEPMPAKAGKWGLASILGSERSESEEPSEEVVSDIEEQAVFVALSSQSLYVFTPTWDTVTRCTDTELQPESCLGLLCALPLKAIGRIDVGPNRQYLTLHSGLLASVDNGRWDAAGLPRLLAAGAPAYPATGYTGESELRKSSRICSSCALMIRDRLTCSDVIDSLAEIGYETRALDAGGVGSGRQRALNHDVEWAMHHLVQQVFLRPATFAGIDDATDDAGHALQQVRAELQRTRSGRTPGALVDAASGDDVIVDKVTYEFLKLYLCTGVATTQGMRARTLVATPQFIYVVRERVDIWPPPVPDLRELYRHWQRVAPPTIVTSDPDTYDPQAVADGLARRSQASSASTARASSPMECTVAEQLAAGAVRQYDCIENIRPVADLRRITLVPTVLAVRPSAESHVFGCSGAGWRAALRLDFDTVDATAAEECGWTLWFASTASAHECVEALVGLAHAAGSVVDVCET